MEIQQFDNIHDRERVFILGNGPSLQRTPLDTLDDEYTIAVNKISKIYTETNWRPSYFVFHDAVHDAGNEYGIDSVSTNLDKNTRESVRRTIELGIPCFISQPGRDWFGDYDNSLFYTPRTASTEEQRTAIEQEDVRPFWSTDITEYICCFASTLTVAAQIAVYMGFDKLFFVGCDLYEPTRKQRLIYPEAMSPENYEFSSDNKISKMAEIIGESDRKLKTIVNAIQVAYLRGVFESIQNSKYVPIEPNKTKSTHFSDDYGSDTERSSHSLNDQMRRAHKMIKLASENHGFEVYNATLGGHLHVYKDVNLNNIL